MFDVCIIGGGVVGTAILSKLTRLGKKCVLLEKENDVGFGSSKANSAIVHAGFDAMPGTLKAKLNVRGNLLFDKLKNDLKVPFVRNGHLVVGSSLEKIKELYDRGIKNGVKGLKILSGEELHKIEPSLSNSINFALFAKTGGLCSSYDLPIAFAEDAIVNGAVVLVDYDTKKIDYKNGVYKLTARDKRVVEASVIINACGAGFNDISKLLGAETYNHTFKRGEYYILDKSEDGFVKHTVFPLPEKGTKGVLVTPTIHGNILVGPTSYISDELTITTKEGLSSIKEKSKIMFDSIPFNRTIRVFSGVRNIVGDDFVIEKSKLVPNVINVAGICSPGLTASPAIAEYVAEMLGLDPVKEKPNLKTRPVIKKISEMTVEEIDASIKKNPDYGKIVCKCENISLYEIKAALNSVLPASSVDGVKRRVRAGMGRCQGGFCLSKVMDEIRRTKNIEYGDILKDRSESNIIKSKIGRGDI